MAGEEGERTAEMLRGIMAKASVVSQARDVGEAVEAIGGTLRDPHMSSDMICAYFGRCRRVEGTEVLERIAREGVQSKILTGGDWQESWRTGVTGVWRSTGRGASESGSRHCTWQDYHVPSNASKGYDGITNISSWGGGAKGETASHSTLCIQWGRDGRIEGNIDEGVGPRRPELGQYIQTKTGRRSQSVCMRELRRRSSRRSG